MLTVSANGSGAGCSGPFEVGAAEAGVAKGGVAGEAGFGVGGGGFGFEFSPVSLEGGDEGAGLFDVVLGAARRLAASCPAVLLLEEEGQLLDAFLLRVLEEGGGGSAGFLGWCVLFHTQDTGLRKVPGEGQALAKPGLPDEAGRR